MNEEARRRVESTAPGPQIRYGVCECEYPCSCCEFEGKLYSSWKDIIADLVRQRDEALKKLEEE